FRLGGGLSQSKQKGGSRPTCSEAKVARRDSGFLAARRHGRRNPGAAFRKRTQCKQGWMLLVDQRAPIEISPITLAGGCLLSKSARKSAIPMTFRVSLCSA